MALLGLVRLVIFTEPQQGATYSTLLRVAQTAETAGFDGFFRSDHYLAMSGDGLPGPSDAWTTLAGLAVQTSRIRLGTLVTSATFRLPGPLAIQVAQVDEMSGGRVELGLGSGWFDSEHQAYGIPFPPVSERFDRLTEQLEIIDGLFGTPVGDTFNYDGKHYQLVDSPALPKPAQPRLPIIVGGRGPKRTPALAARFATEFNVPFLTPARARAQYDAVAAACELIDRVDEPVYSAMLTVGIGRTEREVDRRTASFKDKVALRARGVIGSPDYAVDVIGRYAEAGCRRLYLQLLDLSDLEQLELIGSAVMSQL